MQIVLRAKTKCMRRNKIVKGKIKDYVEKKAQKRMMKNKVEEENKWCGSCKGENKMHQGENTL